MQQNLRARDERGFGVKSAIFILAAAMAAILLGPTVMNGYHDVRARWELSDAAGSAAVAASSASRDSDVSTNPYSVTKSLSTPNIKLEAVPSGEDGQSWCIVATWMKQDSHLKPVYRGSC